MDRERVWQRERKRERERQESPNRQAEEGVRWIGIVWNLNVDRRERLAVASDGMSAQIRTTPKESTAQTACKLGRLVSTIISPMSSQIAVKIVGSSASVTLVPFGIARRFIAGQTLTIFCVCCVKTFLPPHVPSSSSGSTPKSPKHVSHKLAASSPASAI